MLNWRNTLEPPTKSWKRSQQFTQRCLFSKWKTFHLLLIVKLCDTFGQELHIFVLQSHCLDASILARWSKGRLEKLKGRTTDRALQQKVWDLSRIFSCRPDLSGSTSPSPPPSPSHPSFPPPNLALPQDFFTPQKLRESASVSSESNNRLGASAEKRKDNSSLNKNSKRRKRFKWWKGAEWERNLEIRRWDWGNFANSLYNFLVCIDSPSILAISLKNVAKLLLRFTTCYTSFSTQLTHLLFQPLSSDVPEQKYISLSIHQSCSCHPRWTRHRGACF